MDWIKVLLEEKIEDTTIDIINATPHDITLKVSGKEIKYPKSDILARVDSTSKLVDNLVVDEIDGKNIEVELYEYSYGEVKGLPKQKNGVYYIVSAMVLSANKESKSPRTDLLAPDTNPNGGAIREGGLIKAVTRFCI